MNTLEVIQDIFKRCEAQSGLAKPYRFCFYGYTDITLSPHEWSKILPPEKMSGLVSRPNSQKLTAVHGRPDVSIVPTLASVAEVVFGGDIIIDVLDFQAYEGSEILADLNHKIPAAMEQRYDAVMDFGTSEHVFNYPQVLMNSHLLAKPGGFIMHGVPLNMPNHGFYNLSPTLFYDFYGDNHAKTVRCDGYIFKREGDRLAHMVIEKLPQWQRFKMGPIKGEEVVVRYTVQKEKHVTDFVFPVQRKYRDASAWM